ncbi:hypothetical protein BH18ACT5_BH18ACT5_13820 [soil metagenome]
MLAHGAMPGADLMAEVGSGITWSVLVCGVVALDTAAAQPSEAVMGVLGFLFAPIGFAVAKGVQRGIQTMVDVPVADLTNATLAVGAIKAVEYAVLSVAVALLLKKAATRARNIIGLGLLLGTVFGGVIVAVMATQTEEPLPGLVGTGVDKLLFPAACALILYSASRAGKYVRGMAPQQTAHGLLA